MRMLFVKLAEVLLWLVGIFVYPFAYLAGKAKELKNANAEEEAKLQSGFVNFWAGHDESSWYDRWYGLYELADLTDEQSKADWFDKASSFKRFLYAYWWGAFRNFCWGGRKRLQRFLVGTKTDIKVRGGGRDYREGSLRWMNKKWHGWMFATFKVNGKKTFRFSFTIVLFGLYWNVMLGAGEDRYITKNRGFWGYFILMLATATLIFFNI